MASIEWLDNFWGSKNDGKQFVLCGASLGSVEETRYFESLASEDRDPSSNGMVANIGTRDSCDDDEGSVVSESGVSVLSIDYENNEIAGLAKEKVDLSDIGDDESTVVSYDSSMQDIDEDAELSVIKENLQQSSSKQANLTTTNTSSKLAKKQTTIPVGLNQVDSVQIAGNSAAEEKRKQLLMLLRNCIATHGRYTLEVGDAVFRLAAFHESANQHEMAVTLYVEALNIFSSKLGDHDTKVTDAQVCLGRLKEHLEDVDAALEYYCRALSMIVAMTGVYEESASTVRVNVARIYLLKGFYKEAVKELKKSLRGFRDIHGDEHVTVAETVDLIANAYTEGDNHDKAKSVRGELVKLQVALHGSKSTEVAEALSKWATTFVANGDSQGALKVMKQSYVMFHEVEGPDADNTESALEQIGHLYSECGKEEKAIKAHASVAVKRKMKHGEQSVQVASSYVTLGKCFSNSEQYDKAMRSFNKAMTIYGKEDKSIHIEHVMDILHQIGVVHKKNGKPSQAVKVFLQELFTRKKKIPDDKQSIATVLAAIGGTYFDLSKNEAAYQYLVQSLELFDKVEGRRLQFADVLFSCGDVLKKMNDKTSSKCYLEALQIYKANGLSENDPYMQQMLSQSDVVSDGRDIEPSLYCSILDKSGCTRLEM